jgi:hypothetical protein
MDEWAIVLNDRIIKRFSIEEGQSLTIGRGQESDIVVDNTAISRQHCSLESQWDPGQRPESCLGSTGKKNRPYSGQQIHPSTLRDRSGRADG